MIFNDASSHDRASHENHTKSYPVTQEFRLAISMHLIYFVCWGNWVTVVLLCDSVPVQKRTPSFLCLKDVEHRKTTDKTPKKAQVFLCEKELLVGEFTEEQLKAVVVLLGLRQGFSALGQEVA